MNSPNAFTRRVTRLGSGPGPQEMAVTVTRHPGTRQAILTFGPSSNTSIQRTYVVGGGDLLRLAITGITDDEFERAGITRAQLASLADGCR
jgi:hypothetical protein